VFHGDTLRVKSIVVARRESRSRPDAGIVEFRHEARKQDGTLVAVCTRQALMHKKPREA
jgi:acyl dehydratase